MDKSDLIRLLNEVATGKLGVEAAGEKLFDLPYENLDYACVDHHRSLRKGFPEVIYGEGKTANQIVGIMEKMIPREQVVLATRIDSAKAQQVVQAIPAVTYHDDARMLIWRDRPPTLSGRGTCRVI